MTSSWFSLYFNYPPTWPLVNIKFLSYMWKKTLKSKLSFKILINISNNNCMLISKWSSICALGISLIQAKICLFAHQALSLLSNFVDYSWSLLKLETQADLLYNDWFLCSGSTLGMDLYGKSDDKYNITVEAWDTAVFTTGPASSTLYSQWAVMFWQESCRKKVSSAV